MNYSRTLNLPTTAFPMRAGLAQKEVEILRFWDKEKIYPKIRKKKKGLPNYTLHDGPPYANGDIHLGQVLNKILKDVVVKYKTMRGFDAPFVPGWDCHGLPVEHQLFRKLGINKNEISQLEFRRKAREYATHFVHKQREEFKRLGIFGRWENPYLTMDPKYEAEIVKIFGIIFQKGYIYRGLKPIHWCFNCQTALAEAEIEYKERESSSVWVKFEIADRLRFSPSGLRVYLLIWTTTPWTLPANLGIALHPDLSYCFAQVKDEVFILAKDLVERVSKETGIDEIKLLRTVKGKELEGIRYSHPFLPRKSEILLADFVTLQEGTGCVHVAPGHGEEDYELGRRHNLPILSPVDDEGKFTSEVEELEGTSIFAANPLIIKRLKRDGYLLFDGTIWHSYPHCWRCGSPLIFRATPQWFLNVDEHNLRNRSSQAVLKKVKWVPHQSRMRIKSMLEERPDWCLSRQRYWGVGIPVVYCQGCGEAIIDKKIISNIEALTAKEGSDAWFKKRVEEILPPGFKCPKCGEDEFRKEEDIVDVWFESGVSHEASVEREESLRDPADLYLEGSDQHRGWFQSSLLTSMALKGRAPYRKVFTHGFVVDSQGRKMSKSRGNVVDPQKIVEDKGADILRLWVCLQDYTQDVRISDEILNYSVEVYRRIRNTFRFLLGNLYDFYPIEDTLPLKEMREIDRWILSRLQSIVKLTIVSFEAFRFYEAVHLIHNFAEHDLSSFYFDVLKDRLYTFSAKSEARRSAQTALWCLLLNLTHLMAPILSFTSEETWGHIKKKGLRTKGITSKKQKEELKNNPPESIFLSTWPKKNAEMVNEDLEKKWQQILKVRSKALKKLEEAREAKKIASSLETGILIHGPTSLISLLESLGDGLKEVFIVSEVKLKVAPEIKIKVKRAGGRKCERCWNYSLRVGEDKKHPNLCERCLKVVASLTKESL
ncbi:isoleucine--tRNA ligase [Candidatus Aerophobetes bacterium Ae_b3b]|nr:MAG: isoleucine--tRNA ligase [Candidatus Aerophobetes bacterium Ae_b3b]